jgi:hypothetical protein
MNFSFDQAEEAEHTINLALDCIRPLESIP